MRNDATQLQFGTVGDIHDYIHGMIEKRRKEAKEALAEKEINQDVFDTMSTFLSCLEGSSLMSIKIWANEAARPLAWINLQLISLFMQDPMVCYNLSSAMADSINKAFDHLQSHDNGTIH